jgi:hypothetical protein
MAARRIAAHVGRMLAGMTYSVSSLWAIGALVGRVAAPDGIVGLAGFGLSLVVMSPWFLWTTRRYDLFELVANGLRAVNHRLRGAPGSRAG